MTSGSWSSYQSSLPPEARAGGEPDDDTPPRKTVPAVPQPGQRFMERQPWSWDVYDWQTPGCGCLGGPNSKPDPDGNPKPDPACPQCKGTGDDGAMEPYLVAADLDEHDARLLAFGGEAVAALRLLLERREDQMLTAAEWERAARAVAAIEQK